MNKYFVFFLQNTHDFLVYRLRLFIIVISSFVAPLVIMRILTNIPGPKVNGMSKEQIISYYLVTSILFVFLNSRIDYFVKEAIQQGELATYLVKPVEFWKVALVKDLSGRVIRVVFGLPIFIVLLIVYHDVFHFSLTANAVLFVVMLIISSLLVFAFSFAVGLLAFWLEEVWGLQNLKDASVILLSGVGLPYSFFPVALQKFLIFTPFPYLVNWPLRKGFSGNLIGEFVIALAWLFILLLVNKILWKKGLRRYSGLGTY
jgi:ABC-2 type transport system permease protein